MSSQDQNKQAQSKLGTDAKFFPVIVLLAFLSIIAVLVFFLKDKILNRLHTVPDAQSDSPISSTETDDDAELEELLSDEIASESEPEKTEIENFVAPENIPSDEEKLVR